MFALCAFLLTRLIGASGLYYAEAAAWLGAGIFMALGYSYKIKT